MILVGGENLMDMIQVDNRNENALFEAVPGGSPYNLATVSYTHLRAPRDRQKSRMPSSA